MEDNVLISKAELDSLRKSKRFLDCLEEWDVYTWCLYDDAEEDFLNTESVLSIPTDFLEEIEKMHIYSLSNSLINVSEETKKLFIKYAEKYKGK